MNDTDPSLPSEDSPETEASKKPNQISGTMWVWFLIALAVFFGLTYKDQLLKEKDAIKATDAATADPQAETSQLSEKTAQTPTTASPAHVPASQATKALPLLKNGQLLSSANGLTKLLILTEKGGLKCTINATAGQTKAQFQLVEIQALHRTPPVHVATLPADLGTIKLYVVQEVQEITYPDGSSETRIIGLNLTSEGQTETQHYRLQGNSLSLLSPEETDSATEAKSTTSSSPALFMLKGK